MTPSDRERAVELVHQVSTGGFASEELEDRAMAELAALLPDPNVSDMISWPEHHRLTAGLSEDEFTPEVIVELAYRYEPFEV